MKKKLIIVIGSLVFVGIVIGLLLSNQKIASNKELVRKTIEDKYGFTDFKINTVRRSNFSSITLYKVVLKDGYEFDAFTDNECSDCGILPFGKFQMNAYENYTEKYNADVISKYFDNNNIKYEYRSVVLPSEIPKYDFYIELETKEVDKFLTHLSKIDSGNFGLLKVKDKYTRTIIYVKSNGHLATLVVGDPSDTNNTTYFKSQLDKLK